MLFLYQNVKFIVHQGWGTNYDFFPLYLCERLIVCGGTGTDSLLFLLLFLFVSMMAACCNMTLYVYNDVLSI